MGECQCNDPSESNNEVNSLDKDEKIDSQNNYKDNFSYGNERRYNNSDTNLVNLDTNKYKDNKEKNIIYNSYNEQYYGENAMKERYGNFQNQNNLRGEINSKKNNINNTNEQNRFFINPSMDKPIDEYSRYIFENINNIRGDPQSFIQIIKKAKSNITNDKKGICIYKSSVKVALSRGEPAFDEAIDFLRNLKPMNKLKFSPELVIEPPISEEQIKDRGYMIERINEKVKMGIPIKSFWRDIIKDRNTCLILMIVDDTGANSGKKRNDILDPSMQYIGIISRMIGKSFASYVTLY